MTVKFYKWESGEWFVDYPDWKGDQWELEMVQGADIMLDILSNGDKEVSVELSVLSGDYKLSRRHKESGGRWYHIVGEDIAMEIWLCHVTKHMLGEFPRVMYLTKDE